MISGASLPLLHSSSCAGCVRFLMPSRSSLLNADPVRGAGGDLFIKAAIELDSTEGWKSVRLYFLENEFVCAEVDSLRASLC